MREMGHAFLRKETLGVEERVGHAVGHHPIDLYCLPLALSSCSCTSPTARPPFSFFASFHYLPMCSFNDDFCRDLY